MAFPRQCTKEEVENEHFMGRPHSQKVRIQGSNSHKSKAIEQVDAAWMQHEQQTDRWADNYDVCRKGDGELTRRLSKRLNKSGRKGVCGCKGRTRKLERLDASSALCKTNWGGGRTGVVFCSHGLSFSVFFTLLSIQNDRFQSNVLGKL